MIEENAGRAAGFFRFVNPENARISRFLAINLKAGSERSV
jgi:hypothetical protein